MADGKNIFFLVVAVILALLIVKTLRQMRRSRRAVIGDDEYEEMRMQVAMRAFETGNMVTGHVDDEGKLHIKEHPDV